MYTPSPRLATTPSSPAPSKRLNHSAAIAASVVVGREVDRGDDVADHLDETIAADGERLVEQRRRRRGRAGRRRRTTPASRRRAAARAIRPGGCAAAARRSRAPARRPARSTISPSTTQRSGNCARIGSSSSGKYRVSGRSLRLASSTSVAVAEHDAAEPVPLRFVHPAVADRDLRLQLGEHRRQWRGERQRHGASLARSRARRLPGRPGGSHVDDSGTVTVTGHGRATGAPDMARCTLGVEVRAPPRPATRCTGAPTSAPTTLLADGRGSAASTADDLPHPRRVAAPASSTTTASTITGYVAGNQVSADIRATSTGSARSSTPSPARSATRCASTASPSRSATRPSWSATSPGRRRGRCARPQGGPAGAADAGATLGRARSPIDRGRRPAPARRRCSPGDGLMDSAVPIEAGTQTRRRRRRP